MQYQGFSDGLYLVMQKAHVKNVDHYGILDIGNRLGHPNADGKNPVVAHQTPAGIRFDWFQNTGSWNVLGRIVDEPHALQRLEAGLANPTYNLFGNNCEHFARYVATGMRESTQIRAAVFMTGLVALAAFALQAD